MLNKLSIIHVKSLAKVSEAVVASPSWLKDAATAVMITSYLKRLLPRSSDPLYGETSKYSSTPSVSPSPPAVLSGTQSDRVTFRTSPTETAALKVTDDLHRLNAMSVIRPESHQTHRWNLIPMTTLLCEALSSFASGAHSLLVPLSPFWSPHLSPLCWLLLLFSDF